ncbi:methyltransferase domain-containing protein [Streptomyces sp. NPDC017993]|uniref:methyltransferase domain-containing protein n=1 Tax=Streptomyces sp. NPDC017993 TaxID=3365027 RepID=UPI0037A6F6CF
MDDEVWADGAAYEPYAGRWSRVVAPAFVRWLNLPPGERWSDIGCGTGAVTQAVLDLAYPEDVAGVDTSEGYVRYARHTITTPRAHFAAAEAARLPFPDAAADVVVSGLVLNFLPDPAGAVAEMARIIRPGGTVGAYVWDYAEGMQLIRCFWDAARAVDRHARELDEGARFPMCRPEPLRALFDDAGLRDVRVEAVDVPTPFQDFGDYWAPFLGGQGPAPAYVKSLSDETRAELRDHLRAHLPHAADGTVPLTARAWAVRGRRPIQ